MNYPIGIIGSLYEGRKFIESKLLPSDDVMHLDSKANINDIKLLRTFLLKRGLNRKVGVIYGLNKWPPYSQAVLLKIFEQLPEFNSVYYTASFLPNVVIVTRSHLHYLNSHNKSIDMALQMLNKMKNMQYTENDTNVWRVFMQAYSWLEDSVINEKEHAVILKSIGIEV